MGGLNDYVEGPLYWRGAEGYLFVKMVAMETINTSFSFRCLHFNQSGQLYLLKFLQIYT